MIIIKMRTRSQAKKEKLEKQKVPQLNNDVLGIILKHVIKKQKKHIMDTVAVIENYLDPDEYVLVGRGPSRFSGDIKWPDYLNTNHRRLAYHTKVKLFRNYGLNIPRSLDDHIKSKRDLDLLWKTVKHFDYINLWDRETMYCTTQSSLLYVRRLCERTQTPTLLMKKLEQRFT